MATANTTRQALEVVDGGGLYFSRAVTAGPYVFCGGVAADESGGLAPEAQVAPPYAISPPAHVVNQTRYIFDRYKALLDGVGSGVNEFLQVEQHIPGKVYADGYIDASRGKGYMDKGRPSSALLATGELRPQGAVINPTGIALIPDPDNDLVKQIIGESEGYQESLTRANYGESYVEEGPFNEVVAGGPYVFTVGDLPNDWAAGQIDPAARVDPFVWWGNEIRNETDFLLGRLRGWLQRVDANLEQHLVHISIYLIDYKDLYELDRAWKKWFPEGNVARTVIPCRGLGQPRHEGENLGHKDNAPKAEFIAQSIRPGHGVEKRIIRTGAEHPFPDAEAVRADPLLWTSSLWAGGADGLQTKPDTASQLDHLFKRLDDICQAGGTDLGQLVRLRAFISDPSDAYLVYAALKRAVPNDPPTVVVTSVPGPMPYPGATVMIDGVAAV